MELIELLELISMLKNELFIIPKHIIAQTSLLNNHDVYSVHRRILLLIFAMFQHLYIE